MFLCRLIFFYRYCCFLISPSSPMCGRCKILPKLCVCVCPFIYTYTSQLAQSDGLPLCRAYVQPLASVGHVLFKQKMPPHLFNMSYHVNSIKLKTNHVFAHHKLYLLPISYTLHMNCGECTRHRHLLCPVSRSQAAC